MKAYKDLVEEIKKFKVGKLWLVKADGPRTTLKTKLQDLNEFLQSDLFQKILDATSFLPKNTPMYIRIKAIFTNVTEAKICPVCGANCNVNEKPFITTPVYAALCDSPHCKALYAVKHRKTTNEFRRNHSIAQSLNKARLLEKYQAIAKIAMEDKLAFYDRDHVKAWLKDKENSKTGNSPLILDSFFDTEQDYIASLIKATQDVIPVKNEIHQKKDLQLDERAYCVLNDLMELPTCKYCGKAVKFRSFVHGYWKNCGKCIGDKFRETIGYPTIEEMKKLVDASKYEIVSFPDETTQKPLEVKCKRCGLVNQHWIYNGRGKNLGKMPLCRACDQYVSVEELKLREYIKNLCAADEVIVNSRDVIPPYELDIFLPSRKLAFEYDGFYWHNDNVHQSRDYHLKKTELCEKQGIQLVHVFEDEWHSQGLQVRSRIRNLLGVHSKTIYARNCTVQRISSSDAADFCYSNHLQGKCRSSIALGLFHAGQLVSVMTFSKPRFNAKYQYELVRFCSQIDYHVVGAAGKLLKAFERDYSPKSLISYADRRWSTGKLYRALGFTCIGASKPNYWYYLPSNGIRKSRMHFQKHKLKSLPTYNEKLSESENMKLAGYDRIFDCGNLVFVKEYR